MRVWIGRGEGQHSLRFFSPVIPVDHNPSTKDFLMSSLPASAEVAGAAPALASETPAEAAVYRKVAWRLLPFIMACYVAAYLDRVNVGFAKLHMLADLDRKSTRLNSSHLVISYAVF